MSSLFVSTSWSNLLLLFLVFKLFTCSRGMGGLSIVVGVLQSNVNGLMFLVSVNIALFSSFYQFNPWYWFPILSLV